MVAHFTLALRAFTKSRTYAAINVLGLAIGIAACLTILLYIRYETSFDRWIPGAADTYQLQAAATDEQTREVHRLQQSQYVAGVDLKKDFPQVEDVAFVLAGSGVALRGGDSVRIPHVAWANGPFFNVVSLPLVKGDPARALAPLDTAVLSETQARLLFGTTDVVGRTLTMSSEGKHEDYRITGVMRDLPRNSHMALDAVLRFDPQKEFATSPEFLTGWGDISGINYVRLRPGSDPAAIAAAMPAWKKRNVHLPPGATDYDLFNFPLVNVRDVHLSETEGDMWTPGTDRRTLATFGIVALLILGMACTNFVNLATARAGQRAREVALRKVLGATRGRLIFQFLGESTAVAAIATFIALAGTELALPFVNRMLDVNIVINYLGADSILIVVGVLALAVGLLSGLYPAFVLTRFRPAEVLKANQSSAEPSGTGRLRNLLVVAQFAVSIGLIICTIVVYLQTSYARNADPGYRRQGLIQVALPDPLAKMGESLARQVEQIDGVTSAATTSLGIATGSHMGRGVYLAGQAKPVNLGNYAVTSHFFSTLGVKLLAGRLLDSGRDMDVLSVPDSTDSAREAALAARGGNVVVNAAAAKELGFRSPNEAVGKQARVDLFMGENKPRVPVTIVGVVSDARFRSIREPVDEVMFRLGSDYASQLVARYDSARPTEVRKRIEDLWKRLAPDSPVTARFSEDIVGDLYKAEDARARLFGLFAILAVVIGCLGLFGLAAFTAQRRTKEIGIRKVLGARTSDIMKLLTWEFSRPVLIANLIAWPVAWWAMRDWLNRFDARITLGPGPFLFAGLLALAVAMVTIGVHAYRVARANPVYALRYE